MKFSPKNQNQKCKKAYHSISLKVWKLQIEKY